MKKLSIQEKCQLFVSESTFTTKAINEEFFSLKLSDGPAGLRMPTEKYPEGKPQDICLPSMMVIANTWSKECAYLMGNVLASQCIDENVDIVLAPGINIKRTPLCGRNFEYFSEDPYLTGILASEYIKGIQDLGIGTSLKHFCCNNREYDRLYQSSEVDIRTLREIYTKAFELVIQEAQPWTIMCSYNPVNGINVSENKFILKTILRDKLKFENVIISDWGAVHNRAESLKASLDIQFPQDDQEIFNLQKAYEEKTITMEEMDETIQRIFNLCQKVKENKVKRIPLSKKQIHDISLDTIFQGTVLLKNEDNILPLKEGKIALLGGLCQQPSYGGGGSATVYLNHPISPLIEEMKKVLPNSYIEYSRMYSYSSCTVQPAHLQTMNLKHGYHLAYDSDVAVLVVGTNSIIETESYDRTTLKLPEKMEEMIIEVGKRNKNLVVVMEASCVIDMSNWIDYTKAILYVGLAGNYVNEAIAKLLSGKANPSGRLSETFPLCVEDTPTKLDHGNGLVEVYSEGILVGYRWYDSKNKNVLFPFGFGLSYSSFIYENIHLLPIDKYKFELSFDIKNLTNVAGYETPQVYIRNIDMKVFKPDKELKRFTKIYVEPLSKKNVKIILDKDCFEYFNVCLDNWHVDDGRYEILLGKNSRDIQHVFKITIGSSNDYKKSWE